MAFFKFTALAIAIDSCDVAIIAPRTVGLDMDSTVLMARGQTVLPALTPAEAAAEVDATSDGDPIMAGPYDTLELGDGCYFGGRQVQRVAPTADGLGCVVTFGNVPAVLTVPDVDVDTMMSDLNAAGECGGGGGGESSAWSTYTPNYTAGAPGVTASGELMFVTVPPSDEDDYTGYLLGGIIDVNNSTMSPVVNAQITVGLPPGVVTGDVVTFVIKANDPAVGAWTAVFGPDASSFDITIDSLPASGSQYLQLVAMFTPGES